MSKVEHVWHSLSSTQVLKKLNATKKGLSTKEVEKRLGKLGSNELAKAEKFSLWRLFIGQFKSALVYVLLVAGIISIFFGETIDVYVILAAVMLNVVVGFIQEYKANQSLEKLNEVVRKESLVIRDNNEQRVESRLLVPGDIIVLESGNRVPADAKLLSINDFEVNEATLTGESWPVKKSLDTLAVGTVLAERKNMVFMGTLVVEGRAQAVVTGTGFFTEMGKITVMLKETKEEKTPLQKKLDSFAKNITKFVGIVALGLFVLGIVQGHPWAEMFTVAVAVAVAAIPEGLVISMTMILTVGMQRILKNNGLVRRLISAETLGSTTVICTDKTGTLTEGEMRVTQIVTHKHRIDLAVGSSRDTEVDKELDMMSKISFLCNDSVVQNPEEFSDNWMIIGSPTEKALLLYGAKGVNAKSLNKEFPRLEEVPFDSQRKFMVTRHSFDDKRDIIFIRRSVWPLREVINNMQRSDSKLIGKESKLYFRDVYDHTIQIMDTTETFSDMLSNLLDVYLSKMSHGMNEVMKVLTIIATVFIPLTFLTGLYGMNFIHMPELQWKYGYPFALGIMLVAALLMLAYFKKKKWF